MWIVQSHKITNKNRLQHHTIKSYYRCNYFMPPVRKLADVCTATSVHITTA